MNGIINVLKPPNMTSFDVVAAIRRNLKVKKVGHTGTLDPGAAGVLPICLGKATKLVDYIMDGTKTYVCELKLGNKTDTYDKYGEFFYDEDLKVDITDIAFNNILKGFTGKIKQKPPAYSAIKINGKRSYDLAREGIEVDIPEREVEIYSIKVVKFNLPYILMEIKCSKGTYIRSLCHDIGNIIGCGGYMNFLVRSRTGNFDISSTSRIEDITIENLGDILIGMDEALDFKSVKVDKIYDARILNGNTIDYKTSSFNQNEKVKIILSDGRFAGLGIISSGKLHVDKLLI